MTRRFQEETAVTRRLHDDEAPLRGDEATVEDGRRAFAEEQQRTFERAKHMLEHCLHTEPMNPLILHNYAVLMSAREGRIAEELRVPSAADGQRAFVERAPSGGVPLAAGSRSASRERPVGEGGCHHDTESLFRRAIAAHSPGAKP